MCSTRSLSKKIRHNSKGRIRKRCPCTARVSSDSFGGTLRLLSHLVLRSIGIHHGFVRRSMLVKERHPELRALLPVLQCFFIACFVVLSTEWVSARSRFQIPEGKKARKSNSIYRMIRMHGRMYRWRLINGRTASNLTQLLALGHDGSLGRARLDLMNLGKQPMSQNQM